MEPAHFVTSSKGISLSKDINKYLYFHYKDKANNTIIQSTYRCQKYRHGFKVRSCSTKRVQRTGFDSNLLRKQKVLIATTELVLIATY